MTFKVIEGDGDLIKRLEEALAEARSGELEGIVIVKIAPYTHTWTGAYRDGIPYPFTRLQTAVADAAHGLLRDGVSDWS